MNCSNCGQANSEDNAFCENCGSPLQQQAQPKRFPKGAAIAIVLGALIAIGGAFLVIHLQRQAALPVVYGSFQDSRPASDDHGQFLSFHVEEDAASDASARYAVITAEWVPGKYDLDGYEVELEEDHFDIVARVELHDGAEAVAFTPYETLSEGVDWQVSGSFDNHSITLEEGYWTIVADDGTAVPVYVDHLSLPLEANRLA